MQGLKLPCSINAGFVIHFSISLVKLVQGLLYTFQFQILGLSVSILNFNLASTGFVIHFSISLVKLVQGLLYTFQFQVLGFFCLFKVVAHLTNRLLVLHC